MNKSLKNEKEWPEEVAKILKSAKTDLKTQIEAVKNTTKTLKSNVTELIEQCQNIVEEKYKGTIATLHSKNMELANLCTQYHSQMLRWRKRAVLAEEQAAKLKGSEGSIEINGQHYPLEHLKPIIQASIQLNQSLSQSSIQPSVKREPMSPPKICNNNNNKNHNNTNNNNNNNNNHFNSVNYSMNNHNSSNLFNNSLSPITQQNSTSKKNRSSSNTSNSNQASLSPQKSDVFITKPISKNRPISNTNPKFSNSKNNTFMTSNPVHRCGECNYETNKLTKLQDHKAKVHENAVKRYKCHHANCNRSFSVEKKYKRHMTAHNISDKAMKQKS